jgi:dihydrofolate reductase
MTKRIHSPESNPAAISIPPLRAALNGRVIAPEDATYDAETCPGHLRQALGVRGENKHFDTVLMGRKTYKQGLEIGLSSPYPILEQYLFSTTMEESPDEEVTLVSENAAGLVGGLKSEPGKDIWLAGGATLAASHFSEGLVDELMLKVNPVMLGHPALLWVYKEGRSPELPPTGTEWRKPAGSRRSSARSLSV